MSTTRTVTVHCDVCSQWCDDGDHHQSSADALAGAARMGWVRRRIERYGKITTKDICDRCLDAESTSAAGGVLEQRAMMDGDTYSV